MTKTESAEYLVKTLAIESCEQWLEFHPAGGVRAAIPNTPNLIMVGPADWIAKNVPGVEAMVASEPVAVQRYGWVEDTSVGCFEIRPREDGQYVKFADIEHRLAATTQASAAQVEPVDSVRWDLFPSYLIDHCEGDIISEEGLQHSVAAMLKDPAYLAACAATSSTDSALAAEARNAVLVEAAQAICKALPSEGESIAAESACAAVLALRSATATGSGE